MTTVDTTTQSRRFRLLIFGLTVNTGFTDAIGFLGLGGAFTSVMTGNLVMTGLAIGTEDSRLLSLTLTSIGSYVVGVVAGSLIIRPFRESAGSDGTHGWHRRITLAIVVELLILLVYAVGWQAIRADPSPLEQVLLLGNNAVALGIQAAAVEALGVRGLSTTFLTGTLTRVVLHAVRFKSLKGVGINVGTLFSLVAGALLGGVGIEYFRLEVPLVQVLLLTVVLLGSRPLHHR